MKAIEVMRRKLEGLGGGMTKRALDRIQLLGKRLKASRKVGGGKV